MHRALSWLCRAEQCEDVDSAFIFLWISFNAAYAQEIDRTLGIGDQDLFRRFIDRLVDLDTSNDLYSHVWHEFSGSIRLLLDNPFIFHPFWAYQRGEIDAKSWRQSFNSANTAVKASLASSDTKTVLGVIFSRLYTLRNQLVHGGATWQGRVNRDQIRDGMAIMGKLVPSIIEIMMLNPDSFPGDACYPVVETETV
ncbi:HEPN domain-containing protein [Microbulbifer marinus]|uniref:HEPN domain-containing protein n=1 Tax=Microbulbifer marinus TaxID=658218 RepID=UPI001FCD5CDC|nr:HEPN domain-containing protein [Microbulbifer marinus]